jgi:hypothetical protein
VKTVAMAASSLGLGGHTYLPYPQAACREIEHHLLSLSAEFPSSSFEATLSPFTHDDGRDAILVNAAGALPVAGSHVSVWLVEAYQHAPPIVFMPVPDSETTRPAYIDSSGAVTAPYLRHWRWPDQGFFSRRKFSDKSENRVSRWGPIFFLPLKIFGCFQFGPAQNQATPASS